jgi:hypothetical protein
MGSPAAPAADANCNPFDVGFTSAPIAPATTEPTTMMAAPAPAPAPAPMMAGYPAMAPAGMMAAPQGNPFVQAPAPQGNPFAAPAPQGNPFAAPAPQGNPFGGPATSAPAANPFEEPSHDDAFAFAVSNLKGKMSQGQ